MSTLSSSWILIIIIVIMINIFRTLGWMWHVLTRDSILFHMCHRFFSLYHFRDIPSKDMCILIHTYKCLCLFVWMYICQNLDACVSSIVALSMKSRNFSVPACVHNASHRLLSLWVISQWGSFRSLRFPNRTPSPLPWSIIYHKSEWFYFHCNITYYRNI